MSRHTPLPGVEMGLRRQPLKTCAFRADISYLGASGATLEPVAITVADYRPDDGDGSVDIQRWRSIRQERTLEEQELQFPARAHLCGLVRSETFVTFEPAPRSAPSPVWTSAASSRSRRMCTEWCWLNDQVVALQAAE